MNSQTKEVLTILQEEAAEVIVEVSKCFRFGPDQMYTGSELTNIQRLQKELGDLQALVDLLVKEDVGITYDGINSAKKQKFDKLKVYSNIHFQ